MTEQRAGALSIRAALARALVAVLLVLAGLVAPQAGALPARAAPPAEGGAAAADPGLVAQLRADLDAYLRVHGDTEHISAAGLSVSRPGSEPRIDLSAGTMAFGGGQPVRPSSLWQIGSNTKAFTSVLLLQLEAEHRLAIDDRLGDWLPQYPQWRDVTIRRLLNMTSGIPTYDDQPAFLSDYAADPGAYFSAQRLVRYVEGAPATTGYSYSNTNYVLAEMIVERATGDSYQDQLYKRIVEPLALDDLYYRPHLYPPAVTDREPAGYFFNDQIPEMAGLIGHDVSRDSLSWARGAGGILSTTGDMTRWERALYAGRLLPARQQAELESLVSIKTGQPIDHTSPSDPRGFGLGVAQMTDPKLGTFWFYEGETLGFRTLHVYLPDSGVIMAMGLNSQPTQDQIPALLESVYDTLLAHGVIRPRAAGGAPS